jgi:cell division protein FtsZ
VIKEAADPEANIIFGTVIDDRMRDEVKVTVIATGFDATRKPRPASRAVTASNEVATGIEASLDERSREILAEIERDRAERQALEDQMPEASPFAAGGKPAETGSRTSERQPIPVRGSGLDRPTYGETDLDIPSFLRRKSE